MGLYVYLYAQLLSNILSTNPLPSLNRAYHHVIQDERVRISQVGLIDKSGVPDVVGFRFELPLSVDEGGMFVENVTNSAMNPPHAGRTISVATARRRAMELPNATNSMGIPTSRVVHFEISDPNRNFKSPKISDRQKRDPKSFGYLKFRIGSSDYSIRFFPLSFFYTNFPFFCTNFVLPMSYYNSLVVSCKL